MQKNTISTMIEDSSLLVPKEGLLARKWIPIFMRHRDRKGENDRAENTNELSRRTALNANLPAPEMWGCVDKPASHWHTANIMCDN